MSCYYPSLALDLGVNEENKHVIKFLPKRFDMNINQLRDTYGDHLLMLPCGSCLGCKADKAKDWATRCYLESLEHVDNSFITLTYDDEHCPLVVCKQDALDFVKALRNRGYKCRYFGCVEYGSHTKRPHAHLIIFGYFPKDACVFGRCASGFTYVSEECQKIWNKGHVLIGECNFLSAGYVARYTMKKLDDDSCIFMSLKPGIGMNWINDPSNQEFVWRYDYIPGNFGSMSYAPVPRAFNKVLQSLDESRYLELVKGRLAKAKAFDLNKLNSMKFGHIEQVKSYEAQVLDSKLKKLERDAV